MRVVEGESGHVPGLLQRSRRQGLPRTSATCCNSWNKSSLGWGSGLVLPVTVCHSAWPTLASGHPLRAVSIIYHVHGYERVYRCLPATLVAQHKQELCFGWSRQDPSTRSRLPLEAAEWMEGTRTRFTPHRNADSGLGLGQACRPGHDDPSEQFLGGWLGGWVGGCRVLFLPVSQARKQAQRGEVISTGSQKPPLRPTEASLMRPQPPAPQQPWLLQPRPPLQTADPRGLWDKNQDRQLQQQ